MSTSWLGWCTHAVVDRDANSWSSSDSRRYLEQCEFISNAVGQPAALMTSSANSALMQ